MSQFLNSVEHDFRRKTFLVERLPDRINSTIHPNDMKAKLVFCDAEDEGFGICAIGLGAIPVPQGMDDSVAELTTLLNKRFGPGVLGFRTDKRLITCLASIEFDVGSPSDDEIDRLMSRAIGTLAVMICRIQPLLDGKTTPAQAVIDQIDDQIVTMNVEPAPQE